MSTPDQPGEPYTAGGFPPPARPTSPFAKVPLRDYGTDALALLLLLVSVGLAWDYGYTADERVEVVLATVLSALSLTPFYLARAGALPRTWTNRTVLTVRALANVPYVLVVLVYLLLDVGVAFSRPRFGEVAPGGVGPAVAVGLAGVAVAVGPRVAELGSARTVEIVTTWTRRALVAMLAFAGLAQVTALVLVATRAADQVRFASGWGALLALLVTVVVGLLVVGAPLLGVVRQSATWRWVALAVGATATPWFVFHAPFRGESPGAEVHAVTTIGIGSVVYVVLPAAAAVLLYPVWPRLVLPVAPPEREWFDVAHRTWLSAAVVAGGSALAQLFAVVAIANTGIGVEGRRVAGVVLLVLAALAALAARTALRNDTAANRPAALVATTAVAVLGIAALAVGGDALLRGPHAVDLPGLLVATGLPALAVLALTAPAAVRGWYAVHGRAREPWTGEKPPTYAQPVPTGVPTTAPAAAEPSATVALPLQRTESAAVPAQPVVAPVEPEPVEPVAADPVVEPAAEEVTPEPTTEVLAAEHVDQDGLDGYAEEPAPPAHAFTAEQAADPSTELEVLAAIAAQAPELRVHLASNPSTYPDLLDWLGRLGDPEIDAALARRRG